MIKAVFFDVYGTLARFDPPREVIQARAAAHFGITVTKEAVDTGYHLADAYLTGQNAREPVRKMSHDEREQFFARFEQLVLRGAGHEVDLETAARVWAKVREQDYRLALFDDVLPALAALRPERRVGVISNMPSTGQQLCDSLGLTGHVDVAVTSGETGREKPHPAIFQVALERAGVLPSEAVHVGDQLDSDIEGAVGAGIMPVLMDRYGGYTGYAAHLRIEDMAQLVALAERW